jgi:hypothetical protein
MADDLKRALDKSKAAAQPAYPRERRAFRTLLLSNPNYFGNLVSSKFKAVLAFSGNTHYEELGCLGYQPQHERLEGVVYVYQSSGYGTDVCGPGTPEYVRFYLSYDNGATWQDQGLTSFQAYNVPEGTEGSKRLEYAVSLAVHPTRKLCAANPLIRARAILSWNNPPPPNQPNWSPIWGNVVDSTILVEPRRRFVLSDLAEVAKVKFTPQLAEILDLEAPIPTKMPELGVAQLARLYKDTGVPAHRFAYKELAAFVSSQVTFPAEEFLKWVPESVIDASIIDELFAKTDGDTSFEELKCIGLDPNAPDTLVGIVQQKKSSGYSGGPCTTGSQQYVTFWADFDGDGSLETCLGTAQVRVYDCVPPPFGTCPMPPDGISYAVRLPVDLSQQRRNCHEGPRVVRIRAILSWNVPAPCSDPDYIPRWGNREETLINIPAVVQEPAGKMAILGGIPVSMIHPVTGMTTPNAKFALTNAAPDGLGRECPFGGLVTVQGAPVMGDEYMVETSPDGVIWTPVLADLLVTDQNGNTSDHKANPVTKRFAYLPFNQNIISLLARWSSTGDTLSYVRLTVFDSSGIPQGAPDVRRIQLDNTAPDASIVITTGPGNCGKFPIGTQLAGTFVATDTHMGSWSLGVAPDVNPPGVGVPSPGAGIVNTASTGDTWTLDTNGMRACGYVISVHVGDRTIVNSSAVGWGAGDSAGFCLEAPEEE